MITLIAAAAAVTMVTSYRRVGHSIHNPSASAVGVAGVITGGQSMPGQSAAITAEQTEQVVAPPHSQVGPHVVADVSGIATQ